jgi:hypothetical protein
MHRTRRVAARVWVDVSAREVAQLVRVIQVRPHCFARWSLQHVAASAQLPVFQQPHLGLHNRQLHGCGLRVGPGGRSGVCGEGD